ncbi:MAG: hypothetical protein WAL92_12010 [Thiogranum sp.]
MAQVLYLNGYSITVYRTDRKRAVALGRFACNDAGYAELGRLLARAEPQPVSILADLIEEEFREETLPHTMGRDRARLHARHIGKLFRGTPFRHFRTVGRQRSGRRDDQVLFSALTNRDNIEPLLSVLEQADIPVMGVYSLPIITGRLLKPLATKPGNILIVTEQPDSGLRETFIRDGQVHFSRLAPVSDCSPADYRRILLAEANKTRRYLNTLRLLPQDQALDVYALCDTGRFEALQDVTVDSGDIHIHPVNLSHLAQLLGFRNHADTPFSDALFCYLLGRRPTRNHYAQSQHLRNWRSYQARLGLRAATWLLAVSAATVSGMHLVDGNRIETQTRKLAQLTDHVDNNYRRIRQDLPVEPDTALSMREAIQFADRLSANTINLDELFRLMGGGFSTQPNLAMDRFSWFVADSPQSDGLADMRQQDQGTVAVATPFLVSKIHGHVRKFSGSYRQAQQQIDDMARWIASQPGVLRADVVHEPLNTRTDSNLQGGIATRGDTETAEFELRIVMELGHEPA